MRIPQLCLASVVVFIRVNPGGRRGRIQPPLKQGAHDTRSRGPSCLVDYDRIGFEELHRL